MDNGNLSSILLDETRRKIVDALKDGEKSAGELVEICQTSNSNLSHHLNVLKNHGLIEDRKEGRYNFYSLKNNQKKTEDLPIMSFSKFALFQPIIEFCEQKKCEPGLEPDSHNRDKGIFSIFYKNDCLIRFHYSFTPLDSFIYRFEIPFSGNESIISIDDLSFDTFYSFIKITLDSVLPVIEEKPKEMLSFEEVKERLINDFFEQGSFPSCFNPFDFKKETKLFLIAFLSHYTQLFRSYGFTYEDIKKLENDLAHELTSFGPLSPYIQDDEILEVYFSENGFMIGKMNGLKYNEPIDISMEERRKWLYRFYRFADNRKGSFKERRFSNGFKLETYGGYYGFRLLKRRTSLTIDSFLDFNSMNEDMAEFLEAVSGSNINIIVSGGTGAGKTTTLNILSSYIDSDEPITSIEESDELPLHSETNKFYKTHLVLDEIRSSEPLDLFLSHAKNSNFGSMATVHANHPDGTIARLHHLNMQGGEPQSPGYIAKQVDIIVQVKRIVTGERKITNISHPVYDENMSHCRTEDIFIWDKVKGFQYTGFDFSKISHLLVDSERIEKINRLADKLQKEFDDGNLLNRQLNESLQHFIQKDKLKIEEFFPLLHKLDAVPISPIAWKIHEGISFGKSISDSLSESLKKTNSSDWRLFVQAVTLCYSLGSVDKSLFSLSSILSSRADMRSLWNNRDIYEFESSDEWKVLEIVDLLGATYHSFDSLPEMINAIIPYVSSNYAFKLKDFVSRVNAGQTIKEALFFISEEYDNALWKWFVFQLKQADVFQTDAGKIFLTFGSQHRQLTKNLFEIRKYR